jgi:hypothetical protein
VLTVFMGGGIVTRRHVRSQQEWHCLLRWEPTVRFMHGRQQQAWEGGMQEG